MKEVVKVGLKLGFLVLKIIFFLLISVYIKFIFVIFVFYIFVEMFVIVIGIKWIEVYNII